MEDHPPEQPGHGSGGDDDSARKPEDRKKQAPLPPSPRKVGESPDTLRRREQWFQKRQGRS